MNKKSITNITIFTVICLILVGCHPKVINWSPDGKWAAYCTGIGLFFIDGEGEISKQMLDRVYRAEWFPDGKHLAIEQFAELKTWRQVESTVSQEYQQKYVKYANNLLSIKDRREWTEKTKMLQDLKILDDAELRAVQLYIRDVVSDNFPEDVIESWENHRFEFYYHYLRIGTWDGETFSVGEPLWESAERIWDMRVSSKGRVVAFTSAFAGDFEDGTVSSLWAADVETKKIELLDNNTALYPDWDVSGVTLFYVRSIGKESTDNPLGTLLKRRICDSEGAMLDAFSGPESLAGLVANEFSKVRCLKDGRVLFSSMEVTLPVIGKDVPDQKQLFVLNPKQQSAITRLVPRSVQSRTHGYNFDFFEVSPDESVISIPDDEGRVAALTVTTGDFTVLQSADTGEIRTVPVWRYPNELCYIDDIDGSLLSDKKRKQVMLRKIAADGTWSEPRLISKGWPNEARKIILDR